MKQRKRRSLDISELQVPAHGRSERKGALYLDRALYRFGTEGVHLD